MQVAHALQHTATHCSTLQHTAAHCSTLQHTATHCSTLQHTAALCSILQHTAAHCNTICLPGWVQVAHALQHPATHRNTLQHTATHRYPVGCRWHAQHNVTQRNTLWNTAAHYNSLQHNRGIRLGAVGKSTTTMFDSLSALQHTATQSKYPIGCMWHTHYNTLQCTATHCNPMQNTATQCNTLQHNLGIWLNAGCTRTATHCNTLQHPATPCNTLHHTAKQTRYLVGCRWHACQNFPWWCLRDIFWCQNKNIAVACETCACPETAHNEREFIHAFVNRDIHVYIYIYICVCRCDIHTYLCMYAHIHISHMYIYEHTHVHIYMYV